MAPHKVTSKKTVSHATDATQLYLHDIGISPLLSAAKSFIILSPLRI